MILDDVTSFWWESITGPRQLVENLAARLTDGNSAVLQIDNALPWREQLRDFVAPYLPCAKLRPLKWNGGIDKEQIVRALLEHVNRSALAVCPTDYRAQIEYLKNEDVFANTVVWLSADSGQDQAALLRFLSDYRGKNLEHHGAFVLELPGSQALPTLSGQCAVLRCSAYIRNSDLLLYANILADSAQCDPRMKGYIAYAATHLAAQDAELIPEIIQQIDFEHEDPTDALVHMWDEESLPCPDNRPNVQELQLRLWAAQLQSAFAQIEMERLHIAEKYEALIEQAIAAEYWEPKWERTGFIQQHGDELESASDVELGTLVRMMSLRRNDDRDLPLLTFPDRNLRDRIIFLTTCRNNLAHHKVCTSEQMYNLLTFTEDR